MVPTNLLGLVLFIALFVPGLVYVLRRERVGARGALSAFRETMQVIVFSILFLTITGLLFGVLRVLLPKHTLNVRGLVRDPAAFGQDHHVQVAWWSLAFLFTATLIALVAADPRVQRHLRKFLDGKHMRKVTGHKPTDLKDISGWQQALVERSSGAERTLVGALMDNGSYIRGLLVSSSAGQMAYDEREIVLGPPLTIFDADGMKKLDVQMTVLAGRNIVRLDVIHLDAQVQL